MLMDNEFKWTTTWFELRTSEVFVGTVKRKLQIQRTFLVMVWDLSKMHNRVFQALIQHSDSCFDQRYRDELDNRMNRPEARLAKTIVDLAYNVYRNADGCKWIQGLASFSTFFDIHSESTPR
jgi:hypothetical protein